MTSNNDKPGNQIAVRQDRALTVDAEPIFDTAQFDHMARIAGMMACSSLLPDHLRVMVDDKGMVVPADKRGTVAHYLDEKATTANAFLIVNQARLFGGVDPFALAQSSYFVHGRLGYEGKLVQALIERRVGAMKFEYNNANPESEDFGITVKAYVPNANPPREELVYGTVKEWATRKSGALNQQWKGAAGARRMLHYRGTREWARLYAPGLVLGLLDEDDLDGLRDDLRARQATPVGPGRSFNPLAGETISHEAARETIHELSRPPREQQAEAAGADPATGEVRQEGAANGSARQEGIPDTGQGEMPAGGAEEAKPAAKRLPRGFAQKVDVACMKLVEAADVPALQKAWADFAEPLVHQINHEGLPTPSIARLKDAHDKRAANFATMAKVRQPAEDKPVQPAPVAETPTAQQVEDVAPEEEGEDFSTLITRLNEGLAKADTFEAVDATLDTILGDIDLPRDVQHKVDDIVVARREAIGRANAGEDQPGSGPADDFPGNSSIIGNGAPPTAEEVEVMVDQWIGDMRKCRTTVELLDYNEKKIAPFMKGPYGKQVPDEMFDDAKHIYTTRMKLLTAKEKEQG